MLIQIFIPAVLSRCLCELAKQIGFTTSARDIFKLEGQIASYMHLVCLVKIVYMRLGYRYCIFLVYLATRRCPSRHTIR